MDKPWKVISAFIGVFIAGAIFGGVFSLRASGQRLVKPPVRQQPVGQQIGPAMMQQLTQRLKLTEEQRGKIGPLVQRTAEDLQRLRRDNVQATSRAMERMHADIAAWLSPEQLAELEQLKLNMTNRFLKAGNPNKKEGERPSNPRGGGQNQRNQAANPPAQKTEPEK